MLPEQLENLRKVIDGVKAQVEAIEAQGARQKSVINMLREENARLADEVLRLRKKTQSKN